MKFPKFFFLSAILLFSTLLRQESFASVSSSKTCVSLFSFNFRQKVSNYVDELRRTGGRSFFVHEASSGELRPKKAFGFAVPDERILKSNAHWFKKFFYHIPSVIGSSLALERGYRFSVTGPIDYSTEVLSHKVLKQKKKHLNGWVKLALSLLLTYSIDPLGKFEDWEQTQVIEAYQAAEMRKHDFFEKDKKENYNVYINYFSDYRFQKYINDWKARGAKEVNGRILPYSESAAVDYVQKYLSAYQMFVDAQRNNNADLDLGEMIQIYGDNPLFADVKKFLSQPKEEIFKGESNGKPVFEINSVGWATPEQVSALFKFKLIHLNLIESLDYWISMDSLDMSHFIDDRELSRKGILDTERVQLFHKLFDSSPLKKIIDMFDIKPNMPDHKKRLLKNTILQYLEIKYHYKSFELMNVKFLPSSFEDQVEYLIEQTQIEISK